MEESKNKNIVLESWDFIKTRKKYWLLPVIILLALVGLVIAFGGSSSVSAFIYAFF